MFGKKNRKATNIRDDNLDPHMAEAIKDGMNAKDRSKSTASLGL